MALFPSPEWVQTLMDKLNSDERYASIARNWEGDMLVMIDPGGELKESLIFYFDLWHGKCRDAYVVQDPKSVNATLSLRGPYENYLRLLKGELDPMQALLSRKLSIKGSMALVMRNVPTVLDFVRCCREVTDKVI